jgi:bifunctional DNA-binding transcriptional regulator/antitoxin component of YhaV-PrlF toxin-antitoxin module
LEIIQVTIPQRIREQFGLLPDTEVEFVVEGQSVRIVKVDRRDGDSRGWSTRSFEEAGTYFPQIDMIAP